MPASTHNLACILQRRQVPSGQTCTDRATGQCRFEHEALLQGDFDATASAQSTRRRFTINGEVQNVDLPYVSDDDDRSPAGQEPCW